jgi:hypothetical protein
MNSRFEALKKILRGPEVVVGPVTADPEYIIDARGNSHLLSYSELDKACQELAREAQLLIRNEEDADAYLPNSKRRKLRGTMSARLVAPPRQ